MLKNGFITFIDLFYPLFRKIMNRQTYRYAVCGGINLGLGLVVYYIVFTFILQGRELDFGFYAFKAHVAALFCSFIFNVCFGFMIMRYVVFVESNMHPRVQLFRYFMVCLFNLGINYVLLKLLVEILHIYPTIAQLFTAVVVVIVSYIAQKKFSFAIKE